MSRLARMTVIALALCLVVIHGTGPALAGPVRIKDLVEFDGVRGNDLLGYGLVVGLNGTGDGLRNAPFTEELMSNTLERLGVNVTGEQFRPKNVAAVLVTAELPPFARAGSRIDITVSAIGDAKSLLGGTLVARSSPVVSPLKERPVVSSRACRHRARSPRARGSNGRWSLISREWRACGWRCASRISPPPDESSARSTARWGGPWP
jgi:hypothetical protein